MRSVLCFVLLLLGCTHAAESEDDLEAQVKKLVDSNVHSIVNPHEAVVTLRDLLRNSTSDSDFCVLIYKTDPNLLIFGKAVQLKDENRTFVVMPLRMHSEEDNTFKESPQIGHFLDDIKKPFHECVKSAEEVQKAIEETLKKTAEEFHFASYFQTLCTGCDQHPFAAMAPVDNPMDSFLALSSTSNSTLCSKPKEEKVFEVFTFIAL
ncbi:hypothetical protein QR680_007758 [Steinernema hermaphroditum]|uniref:Uncharacterized protein n=1 Tax=Steinernema hermaphroditum TaxID=289476 RepID=A0AA39IFJ7_9BILA|nr:hypothetical protein QR680_007758 [Steinernema hermaphroditum]